MTRHSTRRTGIGVSRMVTIAALLWPGTTCFAQNLVIDASLPYSVPSLDQIRQVNVDPRVRELVSRMDDGSFAAREAASAELMQLRPDRMQIYAALAGTELTPEQRYRLLTALHELLVKTPRGALGIQMQQLIPNNGIGPVEIRIDNLIPGMPAEKVLQIGDRIIEVDHQPLSAYQDLNVRVQTKQPGETVHLRVRRGRVDAEGNDVRDHLNRRVEDEVDISLELGSADDLDRVGNPNQFRQPSAVLTARRIEAEDAAAAFAPSTRPVSVQGGALSLAPAGSSNGLRDSAADLDPEVEQHPWVRSLVQQRRYIDEGLLPETDELRASWELQLAQLYDQYRNQRLAPAQRHYLQRVIERFADLIER